MEEELPPLLLCMENMNGEEVTLAISPTDDFNAFLAKAKSILGFDVDLNSITKNHPVQLTDNIYQFLIQNEAKNDNDAPSQTLEEILQQSSTDLIYILDDGTQINASQIHFDNDDPFTDLTKEFLPFVKYNYTEEIEDCNIAEELTKKINIKASPVNHNSNFINSLPFKLVTNHTSGFEAQFIKHLQGKTYTTLNTVVTKKSPKTLIKDNYKKYINDTKKAEFKLSREDVVNMLKDSPVTQSIPKEKRRHKKPLPKKSHKYIDLPYFPIGNLDSQDCLICSKYVDNSMERLYIFDKEDQKLHRSSPQKRRITQLKILCERCLNKNFVPCPIETQNRALSSDEYLIIRNNQQYIFRLINKSCMDKPVLAPVTEKDVQEAETKNEQIIDIEIIDQQQDIDEVIDNLDEADENVKLFLGKYQKCVDKELVCRFCQQIFTEIKQVIDHGTEHKHELDDGEVYPCPLCDYGYADFKWLKGHLKTAHIKTENNTTERTEPVNNNSGKNADFHEKHDNSDINPDDLDSPKNNSPMVKKTQKIDKEDGQEPSGGQENVEENKDSTELKFVEIDINDVIGKTTTETESHVISTEVKQECLDSDDAIWIVHTDDSDLEHKDTKHKKVDPFRHKCLNCDQLFINAESLTMHRCIKRGRKRKTISGDEDIICIPSEEDFLNRAQGRIKKQKDDEGEDTMSQLKKKNYNLGLLNLVTCHNCNENFTSKVRLKFHMQFHDKTDLITPDGEYKCATCPSKFQLERALFDHIHFRHLARRRWQCPLPACKKTFRLRATLTKHSRIHTDTRRYVCPTCGKRFLDKQTLDEHSVTHLQTKPFQCHICLKQLTRRSRLRMHLRAHEELTPQALLVCVLCHRAFRDKDEAEEHAQTSSSCLYEVANELKQSEQMTLSPSSGLIKRDSRSPSAMKLSERTIPRQASPARAAPLLRELRDTARSLTRVALADRAYRCEYCEDVFYSGEGLNKHRAIHKGVKNPFTCHICKVSFATYSRCTTHKTTHGFYKRPVDSTSTGVKSETGEQILGYGDFPVAKHFMCEDCGRSYLHWTYLQVHRRMKHGNENFLYKCNSCELNFPNSWSVSYHRKKAHGKSLQDDVNGVTKLEIPKTDYRIPCRDCDEFLPNKNALYMHRNKEHCDLSLLEDNPESFYCVGCGNKFQSRTAMANHNMQCKNIAQNIYEQNNSNSMTSRLRNARKGTKTRTNRNAETILVMEFLGLDPSPDAIMARLNENSVNMDKIIDINKISFPKGVKSVIPSSHRALMFISNRQNNERTMTRASTKTNPASVLKPSQAKPTPSPNPAKNDNPELIATDGQTDQPLIIIKAAAPTNVTQGPTTPDGSKNQSDINVSLLLNETADTDQNVPVQFDETFLLN